MNTPVMSLRIPDELRKKLEKLAEKENRSLSNLIVTMLDKAVKGK